MTYYTILYYDIIYYSTLHYTTLHYTTLHYTTLHYTTLHYTPLQCLHSPGRRSPLEDAAAHVVERCHDLRHWILFNSCDIKFKWSRIIIDGRITINLQTNIYHRCKLIWFITATPGELRGTMSRSPTEECPAEARASERCLAFLSNNREVSTTHNNTNNNVAYRHIIEYNTHTNNTANHANTDTHAHAHTNTNNYNYN